MFSARYNGRYIGTLYRRYSGPIWLDNVACTGYETDFVQCGHAGWGRHNCYHSKDVAISCSVSFRPTLQLGGQKLHSRSSCVFRSQTSVGL